MAVIMVIMVIVPNYACLVIGDSLTPFLPSWTKGLFCLFLFVIFVFLQRRETLSLNDR